MRRGPPQPATRSRRDWFQQRSVLGEEGLPAGLLEDFFRLWRDHRLAGRPFSPEVERIALKWLLSSSKKSTLHSRRSKFFQSPISSSSSSPLFLLLDPYCKSIRQNQKPNQQQKKREREREKRKRTSSLTSTAPPHSAATTAALMATQKRSRSAQEVSKGPFSRCDSEGESSSLSELSESSSSSGKTCSSLWGRAAGLCFGARLATISVGSGKKRCLKGCVLSVSGVLLYNVKYADENSCACPCEGWVGGWGEFL